MPTLNHCVLKVNSDEDSLHLQLADGRELAVPLAWFPTLLDATPAQRENVEILLDGHTLHWPELDEDIGIAGMLRGRPAK